MTPNGIQFGKNVKHSYLSVIDNWFTNNNLKINYEKSECIASSNAIRTAPIKHEITIHKTLNFNTTTCTCPKIIKLHPFIKCLGIKIHQNLKLNIHIENLIIKQGNLYKI